MTLNKTNHTQDNVYSSEYLEYVYRCIKGYFKVSIEEAKMWHEKRETCCEACGKPYHGNRLAKHNLAIDHCHTTGKVRGILCESCNKTLGMMDDDPIKLRKLADYIERTDKR